MGLSSKQVCSSGLDWKQTLLEAQDLELPKPHMMSKQQQTHLQSTTDQCLNCPRCDSTNTKFCYYNNYNKSQPRHFCRACKRHWTKGGTLRNVPVGGGRKNKRVKKTPTSSTCTPSISIQTPLAMTDQKTSLSIQPSSLLLQQQNLMNNNTRGLEGKDFGIIGNGSCNGMFTSSTLSLHHQNNSLLFPFSTSASFDTTTCSSSNVYYYGEEFKTKEEPTINSIMPNTKAWDIIPAAAATSGGGMETSNYWNWEDIDSLVSTDLKDPWDDSDIKP